MGGDPVCVRVFFTRLFVEITGKAFQVLFLTPERQRAVTVRRSEFLVELPIQFRKHLQGYLWISHKLAYTDLPRVEQSPAVSAVKMFRRDIRCTLPPDQDRLRDV